MRTFYSGVNFCGARHVLLASACVAAFGLAASGARAQSTDVEEILVTARKREESLLAVPAAVSAITPAELARANATDLTSIARLVPQLQINPAPSGNGGSLIIRGIGSSGADSGLESEVLIDVDGIPTSRGWVTLNSYFDIANVQVLKGPQALFFGKNSPAGVVAIKSAGPTAEWQGFARAGYETVAEQRFLEAAVGGPLTSTLGVRLAFRYDAMEGWIRNVALPIANNAASPLYPTPGATTNKLGPNQDTKAARLTLHWTPTSNFDAELKALVSELDSKSGFTAQSQVIHCGGATPVIVGVPDPYMDCKADRNTAQSAIPQVLAGNWARMQSLDPFIDNRTALISLNMNYQAGPIRLTSVTGYSWFDVSGTGNYDASSFNQIPSVYGENFEAVSQEFRAFSTFDGPLNGLLGIFYERQKRENWNIPRIAFSNAPGFFIVPDPRSGRNELYESDNFQVSETISPFFQLTWNVRDNLELAGGARYTRETKHAQLGNKFVNQGIPAAGTFPPSQIFGYRPAGDYIPGNFKDSNWSPEVTLTWHPTPSQTLYGAYRSGYKSGGFSVTGVVTRANTIDSLTYGSETSKGFDIGYKAELLDRRVTLDAVVYRYDYDDLQRTVLEPNTLTFIVRNAARARIQGVELSGVFKVDEHLRIRADAAYNDAKYRSYPNAQCFSGQTVAQGCLAVGTAKVQDLSGFRLALAPKFVGTVSVNYERPISEGWNLGLDGSVDFNSGYLGNDLRQPFTDQDSFFRLHAGVRLSQADGPWSFELIGRNLTNEYIVLGGAQQNLGATGDVTGSIERPRQIVLQVSYRY